MPTLIRVQLQQDQIELKLRIMRIFPPVMCPLIMLSCWLVSWMGICWMSPPGPTICCTIWMEPGAGGAMFVAICVGCSWITY